MNSASVNSGYRYVDGKLNDSHSYLLPAIVGEIDRLARDLDSGERRVFDLGCGNGSIASVLDSRGWNVTGVDPSPEGIAQAKVTFPGLCLSAGSAYDDLAGQYGQFPLVVSLEVVEHLYDPRAYARTVFELLAPGGTAIISTPYHGYWKNLLMAVSGKLDAHFTALWDDGHIKFWSRRTLAELLTGAGLSTPRYRMVGRLPPFSKSMVAIVTK